jgi:hypothetical protein
MREGREGRERIEEERGREREEREERDREGERERERERNIKKCKKRLPSTSDSILLPLEHFRAIRIPPR